MVKVIRAFRERYHDMKRYDVGDDYPETDMGRVTYLVKMGYLAEPEKQPPERTKTPAKRGKKGADADGSDTG